MSIPFTQFTMPHGRRHEITIDRAPAIELMAHKIITAGYAFEIEMLSDYQTISIEIINAKERVLAAALCHNGPTTGAKLGVPETVDKCVQIAFDKIPKKFQEMKLEMHKPSDLLNAVLDKYRQKTRHNLPF